MIIYIIIWFIIGYVFDLIDVAIREKIILVEDAVHCIFGGIFGPLTIVIILFSRYREKVIWRKK